jgi:hypothetical protein
MESKDAGHLRNIIDCIRKIAGTHGLKKAEFVTGTVKSVDEENRTCSVELLLSDVTMTLDEVALSAEANDGFIQIPAVDSTVYIIIMPNNDQVAFFYSDIEKIICVIDDQNKYEFSSNGFVWNNGTNGGLIKITDLTSSLNTLVTNINTNLTAISAAIASLGGSFAPTPPTPFVKTSYENTKIKH